VFQEAKLLYDLRHPNVLTCWGVVAERGYHATILDYLIHGSLRKTLQRLKRSVSDHWAPTGGVGAVC
jgi:hypothetical protein